MALRAAIFVRVPRAGCTSRPVFINQDMFGGSYRRNGEGDYRCSPSEVRAMVRDSASDDSDKQVVTAIPLDSLNAGTLRSYRNHFGNVRPNHPWVQLDDEAFLMRLGAIGRAEGDGALHPTRAGLLMFGEAWEIANEFPSYFLDCRQETETRRWENRVVSNSGEWSGNVYDFYLRAFPLLTEGIPVPFELGADMVRRDDTLQHKAVREALANAIVHADYLGDLQGRARAGPPDTSAPRLRRRRHIHTAHTR